MAGDDWRLQVDLREDGLAHALVERLDAARLERELASTFRDRVILSSDGPQLFCYAGEREQLEQVERQIREVAREHDWEVRFAMTRWHPAAEAWEDPDLPLPASDSERAAERAQRSSRERAESEAQGYPSFEVRVECRSESDCADFAHRLEAEGLPVVRRSRYLVIGAADEASAEALAARCHREAPDGSSVLAEGTTPAVLAGSPLSPFVYMGGLGG